jgi:HPt (histidine-containing phosphotransfer) domain-containing protein
MRYRRRMDPTVPSIDAGTRRRLTARFGGQVEAWFDRLPGLLATLAQRWQVELGLPIPRGSMSCLGDAAFDAVDLILWQADDLETIQARAQRLAAATGMEARRVLAWCSAFASMNALELASQDGAPSARIEALVQLASRAEDAGASDQLPFDPAVGEPGS